MLSAGYPPGASAPAPLELLQDAHALVIGVSAYLHVPALPRTSDAEDIAAALVDPQLCAYHPAKVRTVLEHEATRARLVEELIGLARRTTAESTVLIYFSGHGCTVPASSQCFLMPVDAKAQSRAELEATTISGTELSRLLREIPAARLTVILDCCRASGLADPSLDHATGPRGASGASGASGAPGAEAIPGQETKASAQLADEVTSSASSALTSASVAVLARGRGRVVMAASRRDGYSYVLPGRRNGLFTELLLDGLRGQAPGIGGVIRVCDLYHYVQQQVVARHRAQRPVFRAELEENYPLALYRGGAAPALVLPPPPDALRYDAFISYCRSDAEDEAWVHDVLLPALESYGLRLCLEERDFRLGRNRIKELERAVTSSRYTLCVLTPSYLAGAFETLCSELAQFHGVESQTVRFLPLLRRPCQPPMAARMLQLLDVSEPGASEHGPGRPRSMTRSAPGSRVRAALARLAVALREPADER